MKLEKMNVLTKKENRIQAKKDAAMILAATSIEDNTLRYYITDTRYNQLRNGEISFEKAKEYAVKRMKKQYEKKLSSKLDKLTIAESRKEILSITISVEWKKSSVWGYNPNAEVTIKKIDKDGCFSYDRYYGYASGCGYDKLSAAIADALNHDFDLFAYLCEVKERAIRKGHKPTATWNESNREYIHYGAGYGALPYFEGGVGSSLFGVLEKCGFKCTASDRSSKTHDFFFYENEKKEKILKGAK